MYFRARWGDSPVQSAGLEVRARRVVCLVEARGTLDTAVCRRTYRRAGFSAISLAQ